MIITPKCYGRYADIDPSSFIINDRSIDNIQPEWQSLIDELIKHYIDNEPNLHSIYIRGSVADGRAIDGISDLDSMAIIDTDQNIPMLQCEWIELVNSKLKEKYPFCDGVEAYLLPLSTVLSNPKTAFFLQTQSVCIYGNDLIPLLPNFRVGDAAAYSHSKNLIYDLDYIRKKLAVDQSPENVKTCCKKIMKRIVRSASEICIQEQNKYTRDLFLSSDMFKAAYPNDGVRIELAMHYALNPLTKYDDLLYALEQLGDWLVDIIENKYGKSEREISFIDDFGFGDPLVVTPNIGTLDSLHLGFDTLHRPFNVN